MPQMSQVLTECAIGMLTAGMSTRAVARELNVHFSPISHLQRRFREFGSTSNRPHKRKPRVTTPAQDLHIQHLHLQDCLRPATAAATIGLHNQRTLAQTVRNRLKGKLICMLVILIGVSTWLQFIVVTDLSGQMLTFDGVWHFGEVFSSRINPGFHSTRQIADWVYGVVWVSGLLMSTLWIEWPMVAVGLWYGQVYVMDNEHRLVFHFIDGILNAQRYRDEILRPIVVLFIQDHHLMLQHGPMLQGSVHNSWKLKSPQFLHGQHTRRTCHPLSMFGMLWIGVYDSVFQFLLISSNFAQPLKRSGPTFHRPQLTTWSTGGQMVGKGKWWSHQRLTGFQTPLDPQYSKTAHFRVAVYCGQPKAHMCNNHAV